MSDDEIIAVVQAHKEGKQIEFSRKQAGFGWQLMFRAAWNFNDFDYRIIEPEPRKPREWIFARYDDSSWVQYEHEIPKNITYKEILHVREVIE